MVWRRKKREQVVHNADVAKVMCRIFDSLPTTSDPDQVAKHYVKRLMKPATGQLVSAKKLSGSDFYIGLSAEDPAYNLERLTKRATLVSDTLLLTHGRSAPYRHIETYRTLPVTNSMQSAIVQSEISYGIHCPDVSRLGRYLIDSEPLLRTGLAWYLPYLSGTNVNLSFIASPGRADGSPRSHQITAVDYLVRDGRAVNVSESAPMKSAAVRFILGVDLPFIDGIAMSEFSKITVEEFNGHRSVRNFIQGRINQLDDAMNAEQSEREIRQIGLDIKGSIIKATEDLNKASRTGAIAATKAGVSTVTGVLVAVCGPFLQEALAVLGVSGGLWAFIDAKAQQNPRQIIEDKWYYVWVLYQKGGSVL
ncbi:hypothetical protein FE633_26010 [Streptomyces montanus]|uniref:Uncharacterized protein n=1 Tax=Streptomyces montanus TaxID=2580423 RepID=A0A5R9FRE3_9ACTN|nr:hypothetical protein [Streptomyces montanus]TLS43403.1 hypothetical protein FE633_26010 [Streptomyces montanus]